MCRDLFFIPLLAKAFAAPDRRRSLKSAFDEIERTGRQEGYERGHEQFGEFLSAATPVGSVHVTIGLAGMRIELSVPFPAGQEVMIPDVRPGRCTLALSTGLVLGELDLSAEDLIWEAAFPATSFKMAADTGEGGAICARIYPLQGGIGDIRTYPGFESGSLGITLVRRDGG